MSPTNHFDRWSVPAGIATLACLGLAVLASHTALVGTYTLVAAVFGAGVPTVVRDAIPVYDRLILVTVGVYGVVRLVTADGWRLDGIVCVVVGAVALLELVLARSW